MSKGDITSLLLQYADGDETALSRILPIVYDTLLEMARRTLRKHGPIATINTGELVHEAYLKLVDRTQISWENRSHFLAVYSLAMRSVLVDLARRRSARKRGGDWERVEFDDAVISIDKQASEILAINEALEKLSKKQPRLTRTVECRFFAGLTGAETARALQVSERTVRRDWILAKTLLYDMLHPAE